MTKRTLFSLIFSALLLTATAQLKFEVVASVPVDSIFFSNITQDNEFQFIPYSQSININLNGPLNDLYNFTFYGSSGKRMTTLWLNGTNVIVRGKFNGKKLEVDTVIGSELYYRSLDFRKRYNRITENKADSATINAFQLEEIERNINNVFSIEIAQNFFSRNISRKEELKKVYMLLVSQDVAIRDHLLNPYRKIENILTRNRIDFPKFEFYTPAGNLEPLILTPGKKYLIDMWFIGCAPCIEQHKEIARKLELLKQQNIEVIGISIDQNQEQWAEWLNKKNYPWKNVREVDDYKKKLRTDMLIEAYPTYFLLDDTGKILYRCNAFDQVLNHLKTESVQ